MKQFTQKLLFTLGFVVLAATVSSILSKNTKATQTAPVLVTNSAAQAVPVTPQGTTAVSGSVNASESGTWNVNAAQSGAWSVGITGTPTVNLGTGNTVALNGAVTVGNTAASPLLVSDVDNPARHPVALFATCTFAGTSCDANGVVPGTGEYTVPVGERLVVEDVSFFVVLPSGQTPADCALGFTSAGVASAAVFVGPRLQTVDGALTYFVSHDLVRAYVDTGSKILFECTTSSGVTSGSFSSRLYGYTVNLP